MSCRAGPSWTRSREGLPPSGKDAALPTLCDLPTPAMTVDADVMERNLTALADFAKGIGRNVRPHTKTHKCPALARRQLDLGAVGLTVATPWEAQVFSSIAADLFVARSVMDPVGLERLTTVAADGIRMIVGVDSEHGVEALANAAMRAGVRLETRIEVDSGQNRCGVRPEEAAVLARRIRAAPHLDLDGIFTHEGHVYSVAGPGGVNSVAKRVAAAMEVAANAIRGEGMEVRSVSVGSTPARFVTPRYEGITEMRPGTYIFNDLTTMLLGAARPEECAAAVLTTVISQPDGRRVVVDGGRKAVGSDGVARESVGYVFDAPLARFRTASEEHGMIDWPEQLELPRLGTRLRIVPFHVCPAVNLYDELALIRGDEVVDILPIEARGYGPLPRGG